MPARARPEGIIEKPYRGRPRLMIVFAVLGLMLVLARAGSPLTGAWRALDVLIALGWITLCALTVRNWRRSTRLRRRVVAVNYLVCPACEYDLSALATPGDPSEPAQERPCPECGTPYSPATLRPIWQQVFSAAGLE